MYEAYPNGGTDFRPDPMFVRYCAAMVGSLCHRAVVFVIPSLVAAACGGPVSEVRFLSGETLSHPHPNGVELSLIPAEKAEVFVEYGPLDGDWSWKTPEQHVAAEATAVFALNGLEPGERYRYRVRSRPATDDGAFGTRAEHTFLTLRAPGDRVRFAFSTDSHVYLGWALAECGDEKSEFTRFERTLENIGESQLDFLILGGDEVQPHCVRCPACTVDGESSGQDTVETGREAELRYRVMRRAYEPLARTVPIFQVLGNHDGEAGFGSPDGRCGHRSDTAVLSRRARLAHFPSPADEGYFAFESGDALFVILDVMRFTTVYPRRAEDWTLGEEQLRWLEQTLSRSDRHWKFLFAHHLVGGSDLALCYSYGRGSIRSTEDRTAAGRFRGEQARIHELMLRHGARVFFSGHDHVFAAGEKDGVLYVVGGQASGPRMPFWTADPTFNEAYDFNEDGNPDYLTDKGFVRVTVEGPHRTQIEYVKTDPEDESRNARVVFQTTLESRREPRITRAAGVAGSVEFP
jgi:hypothetical protein